MTTTTYSNQQTAIAGEHLVAGELSKRGWIATLTSKNTKAIDILATRPAEEDPEGETLTRIDVKTRRPGTGPEGLPQLWDIGSKGVQLSGPRDFLILVALGGDDACPRYWIVPAEVAARHAYMNQRPSLPLSSVREYEERWELLSEGWE
jgi:hypothetical protein